MNPQFLTLDEVMDFHSLVKRVEWCPISRVETRHVAVLFRRCSPVKGGLLCWSTSPIYWEFIEFILLACESIHATTCGSGLLAVTLGVCYANTGENNVDSFPLDRRRDCSRLQWGSNVSRESRFTAACRTSAR